MTFPEPIPFMADVFPSRTLRKFVGVTSCNASHVSDNSAAQAKWTNANHLGHYRLIITFDGVCTYVNLSTTIMARLAVLWLTFGL